ncbi:MAG: UDP-N-acetylglucosamine 1-carboxyvinyltransferase [Acidobacteria bacterium]|nr:UDP-N-acetylglucosamine 1-carboxyvinyltransferase [Acidobacteriota bacterium]
MPGPQHDAVTSATQGAYRIRGGRPLSGTITPKGNKNAALPMLAAALLTPGPVQLDNVPDISDVRAMLALVEHTGAQVVQSGPGSWTVSAGTLRTASVEPRLARAIRASFLLAGPLLARTGRAELPRPGGDRIGRRPLDTHIHALSELGAEIEVLPGRYLLKAPNGLTGTDVFLHEMSVMGTENALMAAALAAGETVIRNAASEPHVQELCHLINAMGGSIEGIGTNVLHVRGCRELHGARMTVGPDHIEVGSFIGLAVATGGELLIKNAAPGPDHRSMRIAMGRLGIAWEERGQDIFVPANQELVVHEDLHGAIPRIDDGPWPAFPPDLTSIAVVMATQARGTILIHEKMFESRLFWVDRLISMGARIILCDPHRAVVVGPCRLYGQSLSSPDIRAGMALVIAALCAEGESTIHNVHQIERGYEALAERLSALGGDIERVE